MEEKIYEEPEEEIEELKETIWFKKTTDNFW